MHHVTKSTRILTSCLLAGFVSLAYASAEVRQTAILSTMSEAALAALSIQPNPSGGDTLEFTWLAKFSDRDWTLAGDGPNGNQKIQFTMSGYLWGEDDEDLSISYSGGGYINDDPIRLNGKADWLYDKEKAEYREMDFRHVMKFGDKSHWGWVVGSEIVVGGSIGVGAVLIPAALATGGVGLGPAMAPAVKAGVEGASVLVTLSTAIRSIQESHDPVAPPPKPARPSRPHHSAPIKPTKDQISITISINGDIHGYGADGMTELSGTYDAKKGTAQGKIRRH
jgi:hypothetical protein